VVFLFVYDEMLYVSFFMVMRCLEAFVFANMIMKRRAMFIVMYDYLMCLARLLQCVNSIV